MSFIDSIKISIKSGNGGSGSVSFRREKYVPKGGPDGGDGGAGGHILLKASLNYQSFSHLKIKKQPFQAGNGKNGGVKKKFGQNGSNLYIFVPVGTIVYDPNHKKLHELNEEGKEVIIAHGGKGGLGNSHFSTSINQTPRYAQSGLPGQEKELNLELKMIAEVGLVGVPNAGKSSLLKCLTKANPKIANYPFTTLFPNLGTLTTLDREIIIADIPGLISGASHGQGLGFDFLKHIERTTLLIQLVSPHYAPEDSWNEYQLVLNELTQSTYDITNKKRIVVISKCDELNEQIIDKTISFFSQKNIPIFSISSFTNNGISTLIETILKNL